MLVDIIVGARPNFIKAASILDAIKEDRDDDIKFRLIHTGQHYDEKMSSSFFQQLKIPSPDINLNVGSGTQSEQTAKIMIGYEQIIKTNPPELCIVLGDVNSTMACAITAKKNNLMLAHVEAGIRSYDLTMPEEINRMVTDSISDYFFTTTKLASQNLIELGIDKKRIFFVGNTMIDTLLKNLEFFSKPTFWEKNHLRKKKYFLLTMHRPSNVDTLTIFNSNIKVICDALKDTKIIFPVHPRTNKILNKTKPLPQNLICVDPLPYLEFNYLLKNSVAIITDSGGITEEATVLNIPCLTLRDSTERPETVNIGTNMLVGNAPKSIEREIVKILKGNWKTGSVPEKWDGKTGRRIVKILKKIKN